MIAPWFADWGSDAEGGASIFAYEQLVQEGSPALFGVKQRAFHVLYHGLRRFGAPNDFASTFAASLYADGSVRLSYISLNDSAARHSANEREYLGLWGSIASGSPTADPNRYHAESVAKDAVTSGSEVVYCPHSALACIPESCVVPDMQLLVRWNGTNSCAALGSNYSIEVSCVWAGGLAVSSATLYNSSSDSFDSVRCSVPQLQFTDGSVVTVDVVVMAVSSSSVPLAPAAPSLPGAKTVFAAVLADGRELARSNLQVRYYSADGTRSDCGCSALPAYGGYSCDAMSVCGGRNETHDCAGTPFGSAYVVCGQCSGGLTGIVPIFNCPPGSSSSGGFLSLISQTIILLMIICCMTFVTSTVSFSVRRMLASRQLADHLQHDRDFEEYGDAIQPAPGSAARGLSEFECDALGQVVFSHEFYAAHKKAQLVAMHGVQGSAIDDQASASSAPTPSCDCPICLMDILEGNLCRALPDPCGHVFHLACIDQWFRQSTSCPLCKRNMKAILEGTDEESGHYGHGSALPAHLWYSSSGAAPAEPTQRNVRTVAALDRIRTTLMHLTEHRNSPPELSSASAGGNIAMTSVAFERAAQDEEEAMVRSGERGTLDL